MKMLNVHDGSKITCEPQPPPSTLDLAPESSASGAARPWEVQDHLVLCSEHLLWGGLPSGWRLLLSSTLRELAPQASPIYGCLYLGSLGTEQGEGKGEGV